MLKSPFYLGDLVTRTGEQEISAVLAFEQALLFAKRSEPCENARASGEAARGRRLLSRASRACTFHDIPQMESLLAG